MYTNRHSSGFPSHHVDHFWLLMCARVWICFAADNFPPDLLFKESVCCRFKPLDTKFTNASDVCFGNPVGGTAAFVPATAGGPFVVCNPPPLPVTPDEYDVFVALDGQNFGDTGVTASGVKFRSIGCPAGYFAQSVDSYCQPCLPGTADSRKPSDDVNSVENTGCRLCALGTYQPAYGQQNCLSCPRADKESPVFDFDTGEERSARSSSVFEGQVSVQVSDS
jgi:hypothetical protein